MVDRDPRMNGDTHWSKRRYNHILVGIKRLKYTTRGKLK